VVGAQWRSALTITPEIGDVLLLKQEGKNGWSSRGVTCMQQKVEMCYGPTRKARVVGAQQTRGGDVLQSDQDCASGQRTAEEYIRESYDPSMRVQVVRAECTRGGHV
jgi:hypothetical protein